MVKKLYPKERESKDAVVKRFTLKYLYFELSIKVQKKKGGARPWFFSSLFFEPVSYQENESLQCAL